MFVNDKAATKYSRKTEYDVREKNNFDQNVDNEVIKILSIAFVDAINP